MLIARVFHAFMGAPVSPQVTHLPVLVSWAGRETGVNVQWTSAPPHPVRMEDSVSTP